MNEAGLASKSVPAIRNSFATFAAPCTRLKGDSAACGFRELSELAHELEDVLTPELAKQNAALHRRSSAGRRRHFSRMLAAYRNQSAAARRRCPARTHSSAAEQARAAAAKKSTREATFAWTEYERLMIAEAFRRGEAVYQLALHLDREALLPAAALELVRKALEGGRHTYSRCARRLARRSKSEA